MIMIQWIHYLMQRYCNSQRGKNDNDPHLTLLFIENTVLCDDIIRGVILSSYDNYNTVGSDNISSDLTVL